MDVEEADAGEAQPPQALPLRQLREGDSVQLEDHEFLVLSTDSFQRLQDDRGRLRILLEPNENSLVFKCCDTRIFPKETVQLSDSP